MSKLAITKETLRRLDAADLEAVHGATGAGRLISGPLLQARLTRGAAPIAPFRGNGPRRPGGAEPSPAAGGTPEEPNGHLGFFARLRRGA